MLPTAAETLALGIARRLPAAATLRARALPRGTRFLALSMPLQYDAMKKVIDALREDDACVAAIKELDAGFWVRVEHGRLVRVRLHFEA